MVNKTKNTPFIFAVLLFMTLSAWWLALAFLSQPEDFSRYVFGASYGLMALFGGLYGIFTAKKWGAFKSSLGRAILFLAAGLLMAEFGQIVFSYYNIVQKELIPYPSLADIGFFGSIPMYILGAFSLSKVLNVSSLIKKDPLKLVVGVLVPLALLAVTYTLFLKGYTFSEMSKLIVFLDFGYPLGEVIYVSLALVTLLCVSRLLGGTMKKPLTILLCAFIAQYIAEFNFLYQNSHETWINGGYGDYLYLIAYFVMTISLIKIANVFAKTSSRANSGTQTQNGVVS